MISKSKVWLKLNVIPVVVSAIFIAITCVAIYTLYAQNIISNKVNNLPLRTNASIYSDKRTSLAAGKKLIVLDTKANGWIKVMTNDEKYKGWVAGWLAKGKTSVKNYRPIAEASIVIDPGHGGNDSGAIANDEKHFEKEYTLQTALKLKQDLEKTGANIIMTRTDDSFVYLNQIVRTSNNNQADAFISLHFNSSPEKNTASGIIEYYYKKGMSKKLANIISDNFNSLPLDNLGPKKGNYKVLRENTRPAVLLELGYINNDKDFKIFKKDNYQKKVAQQITTALEEFFK